MLNHIQLKNSDLFDSLENLSEDYGTITDCQNYFPIYNTLFDIKEETSELELLVCDNVVKKVSVSDKMYKYDTQNNIFMCDLLDISNNTVSEKDVFVKLSPLMNVTRYLTGKYDKDESIFKLPKLNSSDSHSKLMDINNSSYTDCFFTYLSSILKSESFIHGVEYYGSYLGIKNNYVVDIGDDIDYLMESQHFIENIDKNYSLVGDIDRVKELKDIQNISKKYKAKIEIKEEWKDNESEPMIDDMMDFQDVFSEKCLVKRTSEMGDLSVYDIDEKMLNEDIEIDSDSDETDSSGSVNTDDMDEYDSSSEDEDSSDEEDEDSDCSSMEELNVKAKINKFPVQMICMELCENTFDSLIESGDFKKEEWASALLQTIMILITYDKAFWFTHNDLHSNNIMYTKTEKKYIYYKLDDKYYKVPTFGRIFKLIDFGRSIYKFKGNLYCSDAFKKGEDAATQYNFPPYFDNKKEEILPNPSFDLCRLACSLFDNIFLDGVSDEYNQKSIDAKCRKSEIANLINEWCKDDKKRNVLYTSEGEERYPEFKLYKMIARTVHNHKPKEQLNRDIFNKYLVTKKSIRNNLRDKKVLFVDIDKIPKMYN
jgi:hypothetical protein